MPGWTLDQLRTLVAVADTGSMTQAAARLGYTPGAVSQQMASLTKAIGRPVFVRSGRGLALSDTGMIVVGIARDILAAESRAADTLAFGTADRRVDVLLGVFGSAAVAAIPAVTAFLREHSPATRFRAQEVDVEEMPNAIADDVIDLALGLSYSDVPLPPQRGVTMTRLFTEPFDIVLPPEALGLADDTRALTEYANTADWILPPTTSAFGKATRFACAAAGIQPRVTHLVTDTAVSISMAEAGVGITLATSLMMNLHPSSTPRVRLEGGSTREIVAIIRSSSLERASVRDVLTALQHAFDSLTAEV